MCAEIVDLEDLGSGGRLLAIRKVKRTLYRVQAGLSLGFSALLLLLDPKLQLVPLHIPLDSFLYFLLAMGLIFVIEACVFRSLEIRFAKNPTSRYFMVERTQRRSLVGLILVTAMLALSLSPVVIGGMEGSMSVSGHLSDHVYMYNMEILGLTHVESIELSSSIPTHAYLVEERAFMHSGGDMDLIRQQKLNTQDLVDGELVLTLPDLKRGILFLVVDGDPADYTVRSAFSPALLTLFPILMGLYFVTLLGWLLYLMPTRLRLAREAIYR